MWYQLVSAIEGEIRCSIKASCSINVYHSSYSASVRALHVRFSLQEYSFRVAVNMVQMPLML